MLTGVEVSTIQGAILGLSLEDIVDGYIISEIEGLDPVKATVVSSSYASMDGEVYESSRREKRNIIIHLDLEPDWTTSTVTQLRNSLYGFFLPKAYLSLRFYSDDGSYVDISGVVESFESPLFTNAPSATISILCFDPDFYDPNQVTVPGTSVSTNTPSIIHYDGTTETGFEFELNVNRTLSEFSIFNTGSDGLERTMRFVAPFVAGDVLKISTVPGNKYVTLTRGNSDYALLYSFVDNNGTWISLQPGDNSFYVSVVGAAIPFTITYFNKYGGL